MFNIEKNKNKKTQKNPGIWAKKGIVKLDNGLVIRYVEVIKNFLHGLLDMVTRYAKTVSADVVAPMLEVHIMQTLFLQTQTMARKWERLCFLQREVTRLQKWMVSVFPSTADHFVHQQPGTQVETIGDAFQAKLCKPILNYRISSNIDEVIRVI